MLWIDFMLSRTERIDEFHLKVTRTEKELYEEFLKTEEATLVLEMQQYFAQAKGHASGIGFDNARAKAWGSRLNCSHCACFSLGFEIIFLGHSHTTEARGRMLLVPRDQPWPGKAADLFPASTPMGERSKGYGQLCGFDGFAALFL
jgi:hypothetical protein